LRSMSERKTHLAIGMLIGMGVMLIMLGFFGWFWANYLFERLSYVFSECGIDINRHYLIKDLSQLRYTYVFFVVIGLVSLLIGVFGVFKEKIPQKKISHNE
jgi:hypothetical protein